MIQEKFSPMIAKRGYEVIQALGSHSDEMPFEMPTVSVVVPARNEAQNLPYVLPKIPEWVHEIILVDGGSRDDTVAVARRLIPDIRIVTQHGRGKGNALRAGFEAATGDIIVMIDADGSTKPEEIPAFVGALIAGADYAKGTRFMQGAGTADISLFRSLGNWVFVMIAKLLFGGRYTDLCYGYNAFWARILPGLDLDSDGFEIETLMNLRALEQGLKIVEVASFEAERIYGSSSLRAIPDGWRVLKTIAQEFVSYRLKGGKRTHMITTPVEESEPMMNLLLQETLHLVLDSSQELSPESCYRALEALRLAFLKVPELQTQDTPQSGDHQFSVQLSYEVERTSMHVRYDVHDGRPGA